MDSPGMFLEGFCQKHTISLLASLMLGTVYPKPISNSSDTRQPLGCQPKPKGLHQDSHLCSLEQS